MAQPPFLLLMPSFNQAHYIESAVRSVIAQDDANWELWIVDNSSDATPEVMRKFADPRVHFHHIPERMDPGTCLNWMLARTTGRDFSYIHTDNNLRASYVRRMRAALASHPLGLAYCDMRVIDEHGNRVSVFRRGAFDLARLVSVDTLGVPFAATTELARRLGGFSPNDIADDVHFCVSAYGLATYCHLRQPLLDYRLHSRSRTEDAGGPLQMQHMFVNLVRKIVPVLEQRGLQPRLALQQGIRDGLDDLDLFAEEHWYLELSTLLSVWRSTPPRFEHLVFEGLIDASGFSSRFGQPPRGHRLRSESNRTLLMPFTKRKARHYLRMFRDELSKSMQGTSDLLMTWACMQLNVEPQAQIRVLLRSMDFRTLWVARQLQIVLKWQPVVDPATTPPAWLPWERADRADALLDCSQEISLIPLEPT